MADSAILESSTTYDNVLFEVDGAIATVTVNRPKQLNALNTATLGELTAAFSEIAGRDDVLVVILTGAGGRAFIAGADIKEMSEKTPLEGQRFAELGHNLLLAIESLEKPVIAAIPGFALGGGTEVCLACDLVYASETARFGQPEVNLGIIPGFGGTQRLGRLVGRNVAKEIIFTGDMIDAERAQALGLVNGVFPADELMAGVRAVAKKIAQKGPLAIAAAKRAINEGIDLPLRAGLEIEKGVFAGLFGSHDQREGMTAFVEKRRAEFTGE